MYYNKTLISLNAKDISFEDIILRLKSCFLQYSEVQFRILAFKLHSIFNTVQYFKSIDFAFLQFYLRFNQIKIHSIRNISDYNCNK